MPPGATPSASPRTVRWKRSESSGAPLASTSTRLTGYVPSALRPRESLCKSTSISADSPAAMRLSTLTRSPATPYSPVAAIVAMRWSATEPVSGPRRGTMLRPSSVRSDVLVTRSFT